MDNEVRLIARTAAWVRQRCQSEGSHDWFHVERVWRTASNLAKRENPAVDRLVVELAALLHDIADAKYHDGDESLGPRIAREWLDGLAADPLAAGEAPAGEALTPARQARIVGIIATMSFRHGLDGFMPDLADREFAVVRDADRLDAMGAIGIARAFAYGGSKGRPLHDPEKAPENHASRTAYLQAEGSSLNHFYEKLLLLKDGMLSNSGRAMAESRHAYMLGFVERFLAEWEGEA